MEETIRKMTLEEQFLSLAQQYTQILNKIKNCDKIDDETKIYLTRYDFEYMMNV